MYNVILVVMVLIFYFLNSRGNPMALSTSTRGNPMSTEYLDKSVTTSLCFISVNLTTGIYPLISPSEIRMVFNTEVQRRFDLINSSAVAGSMDHIPGIACFPVWCRAGWTHFLLFMYC